jgi:cyclic beta-1,2-glucan synthetase
LRRGGDYLWIEPCIPASWTGFRIDYRHGRTAYEIHVHNPRGCERGRSRTTIDGVETPDGRIPLTDDGGDHKVEVFMSPFDEDVANA